MVQAWPIEKFGCMIKFFLIRALRTFRSHTSTNITSGMAVLYYSTVVERPMQKLLISNGFRFKIKNLLKNKSRRGKIQNSFGFGYCVNNKVVSKY